MEKPPIDNTDHDELDEDLPDSEYKKKKRFSADTEATERRKLNKDHNLEQNEKINTLGLDGSFKRASRISKNFRRTEYWENLVEEAREKDYINFLIKLYNVAENIGGRNLIKYIENGIRKMDLDKLKKAEGFVEAYEDDNETNEWVLNEMGIPDEIRTPDDLDDEKQKEFEERKDLFIRKEIATILATRFFQREYGTEDNKEKPLSWEVVHEIDKTHQEDVKKVEKEVRREIQEVLLPKFKEKIKESNLPINEEEFEERVKSLTFHVVDGYTAQLEEIGGRYYASENIIRISLDEIDRFLEKIFVHEMCHAISGQTDVEEMSEEFASSYVDDPMVSSFYVTKVGLSFTVDTTPQKGRLSWLNEAVTEQVSMELDKRDWGSYEQLRDLLQKLISIGLPYDLALKAYFENYQENNEGHKTPNTKEFFVKTNELWGRGFLMKIDKFLGEGEESVTARNNPRVAALIDLIEGNGASTPEKFDDFVKEYEERIQREG